MAPTGLGAAAAPRVDGGGALAAVARAGYAARGVVYLIVGGIALSGALGGSGETADTHSALVVLLGQPFGKALLAAVGAGLVGFAAWRAVQCALDTDGHGRSARGLAVRAALGVSALAHLAIAAAAFGLAFGWDTGGGGGARDWTAELMRQPAGRWLVAAVGVAVLGAGAAHAWKGWQRGFERTLELPPDARWAAPVCQLGLIARGVVFAIIGGLFLLAAFEADPSEAGGMRDALRALQSATAGRLLFAGVAAGLFAFGAYGLMQARYRRVHPG